VILQGKTVIVSGVGPGLGGEVASIALREGANVVIAARNGEKLESLAKQLDASGKRVAAHAFDITDAAACEGLVAFAEQRFGGVDALVQVAAFDAVFGDLEATKPDDWRRVMEVNVIGTTQLCRALVPALERRGGGSLVLIGSQS
jgi:NAD(P)-dependent dehydrogenase (short-subunit alcohol dehydrogenase family)